MGKSNWEHAENILLANYGKFKKLCNMETYKEHIHNYLETAYTDYYMVRSLKTMSPKQLIRDFKIATFSK